MSYPQLGNNQAPFPALDPARQEKAREYAGTSRRLYFMGLGLGIAFLVVLLLSGFSRWLRDFIALPHLAQMALYGIALMAIYGVISMPLLVYRGFVLPRRYGLSTQTLRAWLFDLAKGGMLGATLGAISLVAIYWLLANFPATWWLWAALMALLFTVILANLAPILIVPLFYKQKLLEDTELVRRLLSLAERARVKVCGVFVMNMSSKGTTANAALMGLGNTRRIVLGDTLFDRYSPDEIESILAHELGHHSHRDIVRMIAVQSAVTLVMFYLGSLSLNFAVPRLGLEGVADIAAFPVLALTLAVVSLGTGPLLGAYSRHIEQAADDYALRMTAKPKAFIQMMTRLTDQNLSEAQPSRWVELFFYEHPPYYKRVAKAREYAARAES